MQWLVDNHNKTTEAENTARVLERNLWAAEDALKRSMADGRYRLYDLEVNVPIDDEKLLADRLHDDYEQVATAASEYRLEFARAREQHIFVQDDYVQLACAMETVAKGRLALNGLTGVPRDAVLKDIREARRACRGETVRDVAQLFYDNFVDGHGTVACQNVYGRARRFMKRESPNCDEDVRRPEHPTDLHPYAHAIFNGDRVDGGVDTVNVKLQTAGGGTVGNLVMTDQDRDNVWHIVEIRDLKTIALPRVRRKEAGKTQGA